MKQNTRQNSTESTLTPKQIQVIEALASGASVSEAAKRAGVNRSTVYLWRRDSRDFEARLTLARRECADNMRARLRKLEDDAIKTIRETLRGRDIPPGVRREAALSVLQSLAVMDESTGDAATLEESRTDPNRPVCLRVVHDREPNRISTSSPRDELRTG
jgi:transposase-like protein